MISFKQSKETSGYPNIGNLNEENGCIGGKHGSKKS